MNESKLRAEINNAIARLWLWPETQYNMRGTGSEGYPEGRPDTIILNWRGPGGAIEYKMFDPPRDDWAKATFPLSAIKPGQRAWLSMSEGQHAYLGLGTRHGTAGAETHPRYAWVIPWRYWLEHIEAKLLPIQASLPLTVCSGLRHEIQERKLVADVMLKRFALTWYDGKWHVPDSHPLYSMSPPPYRVKGERDLKAWRREWAEMRQRFLPQK